MSRKRVLLLMLLLLCCFFGGTSQTVSDNRPRARGLFPFISNVNQKIGYVTPEGHVAIRPQFDKTCHDPRVRNCAVDSLRDAAFFEGFAKIKLDRLYGYIDQAGVQVVKPQYQEAGHFSGGLAWIQTGYRYGYIDTKGNIRIKPIYDEAHEFSGGVARVKFNGKYGYINADGGWVIEPTLSDVGDFSDGLAPIKIGEKYGYIDQKLKTLIPARFDEAWQFSEGLARVKVNKRYGYIDKRGLFKIDPKYYEAEDFSDGWARVQNEYGSDYHFIDKEGAEQLRTKVGVPYSFRNGLAVVDLGSVVLQRTDLPGGRPPDGGLSGRGGQGCWPLFKDKLLLRFGYLVSSGELILQGTSTITHLCVPQAGPSNVEIIGEPDFIKVQIQSVPAPATVYLVTLYDWEHTPNLIANESKLQLLRVGQTPFDDRILEDTYMIVLEYQGKRLTQPKDFNPHQKTTICIPVIDGSVCPN